jgi:hypothetical protein
MTTDHKLGRRKLLKAAAIAGAGSAAGAVAVNSLAPIVLPEEMVFEPNRSHWAKELPAPNSPLATSLDADVVVIGGGPVDYTFNNGVRDRADAPQRYSGIHRELLRIFPRLAGVEFEATWGGSVDMSLDQSPAVGRMGKHNNVFYGIGFSGHGVNLTSVFGRIIADLAARRDEAWSWLPYLNHLPLYTPNEPFRWLGMQLSLAYYRATEK